MIDCQVLNHAHEILAQYDANMLVRKSNVLIALACIFIAARQEECPLIAKEICKELGVKERAFTSFLKKLRTTGTEIKSISTESLLTKYIASLNLDSDVNNCAAVISKRIKELVCIKYSHRPSSQAIIAVALALNFLQKEINFTGLSDVSGLSKKRIEKFYLKYKDIEDIYP